MKEIPTSQGKVALVDDPDFEWLSRWKWFAQKRGTRGYHAVKHTNGFAEMGRLILGITDPKVYIARRNRNGLDNRRLNLRVAADEEVKAVSLKIRRWPLRRRFNGCVYFIRACGCVKIGVAVDAESRMRDLQVGCPAPLELIGSIPTDNPYRLESILHSRFRNFRTTGEWFRLPETTIFRLLGLLRKLLVGAEEHGLLPSVDCFAQAA